MGYTTEFDGEFTIDPPLTMELYDALCALADDDGTRKVQGAPDSYCQWVPTRDGKCLKWDGNEKFYKYVEWLSFIAEKVLAPTGRTLTGDVTWRGESRDDRGVIHATAAGIEAVESTGATDAALHSVAREMYELLLRALDDGLDYRLEKDVRALLNKAEADR